MGKILGTSTVRERGVITIPQEARKTLHIKQGDSITLIIEHGQVVIKKTKTTYENFKLDEKN